MFCLRDAALTHNATIIYLEHITEHERLRHAVTRVAKLLNRERLLCSFKIKASCRASNTAADDYIIGYTYKLPALSAELVEVSDLVCRTVLPNNLRRGLVGRYCLGQ